MAFPLSTFGNYRGGQVYLMHVARNDENLQFPMICKLKLPIPSHYKDFLERKVENGYKSHDLILGVENETVWVREPAPSRRARIQPHPLMLRIDSFKRVARHRLAMNRIRQRRRAQRIHEELVSVVWSPAAFQKRLDMGLTLDEVCEL